MDSFSFTLFLIMLLLFSESARACSCVVGSLSKRFRQAEAIFVGRLADYEGEPIQNIQNYKEGRWVLDVKKSFKGVSKDLIAIDLDMTGFSGACPSLTRLEDEVDYLIFGTKKILRFALSVLTHGRFERSMTGL